MKTAILLMIASLTLGGCSIVSKTPEPSWSSVQKDGEIEIRQYDQMIVAEVVQKGERYDAINAGFRVLAGYIFGGNQGEKKIAMTAPVVQQSNAPAAGQKITMTAPVIQQNAGNANEWKVGFVMPSQFTLDTLPTPNDKQIKFAVIPTHKKATIRFSGFNTDKNLKEHQDMLVKWMSEKKIHAIGDPVFAFYNPPWTPYFLKRNEVMIDISE
jgi:hypothetical protein